MGYRIKKNGEIVDTDQEYEAYILVAFMGGVIYYFYTIIGTETPTAKVIMTAISVTTIVLTMVLRKWILGFVGLSFLGLLGYGLYSWIMS